MNSTSGHSVVELKEPATLTHSLNIQPNKRERDNLSPSLAVSNRHQAGDHNWKNLFRGPASAATVTTPITKHSQGSWHKETHWAVVIHFRWALSHEDRHRRPEQQTEERSLRFLSQQEKVEQSSTGSDELWGAEVGCHKNFSGFQSPPLLPTCSCRCTGLLLEIGLEFITWCITNSKTNTEENCGS